MTGKLNNPVFGQPTHRIISVLLHDIKTEGLVPGEGKLGIKKKEQSLKKNEVTGGTVSLFFTRFIFLLCFMSQFPKQLYQHVRQAASCDASAGTGRKWG